MYWEAVLSSGDVRIKKDIAEEEVVVKNEFYSKTHRVGREAWLMASENFMSFQ